VEGGALGGSSDDGAIWCNGRKRSHRAAVEHKVALPSAVQVIHDHCVVYGIEQQSLWGQPEHGVTGNV
jgi:hypothetical protein